MIAQANRTALVVVPTFNERDNLPVLAAALMVYPEISLLIVDDNSPDGTGELADKLARTYPDRIEVLHRTANRGLGRSYVDGIRSALNRPVESPKRSGAFKPKRSIISRNKLVIGTPPAFENRPGFKRPPPVPASSTGRFTCVWRFPSELPLP